MPTLPSSERLQPSLLDRLTDDHPDRHRESRLQRVISMEQLRGHVLRDLESLLNTGNLEQFENLDQWPRVRSSVLNYGSPDLAGRKLSEADIPQLEKDLRQAILHFEPRILKRSLKVTATVADTYDYNRLTFVIEGDVWSDPMPQQLLVRTEIDLETGRVTVNDES